MITIAHWWHAAGACAKLGSKQPAGHSVVTGKARPSSRRSECWPLVSAEAQAQILPQPPHRPAASLRHAIAARTPDGGRRPVPLASPT